ncbi:transcriptional regulator [Microbacterium faecale]|uniref:Transcriptional regulator n=1 Tax=Microbacterium faecale TaxID=1804630 RepID=A0A916YJE0_9MICO|nr:transcriptional regulator [Microbacterium faecale]
MTVLATRRPTTTTRTTRSPHLHAVPSLREQQAARAAHPAKVRVVTSDAAPTPPTSLPAGTSEPRGFALYVGLDEAQAASDGISLNVLVDALRRTIGELAPHAETYATVALAPQSAGGRDIDVVRLALKEPGAVARVRAEAPARNTDTGVTVDISRKRVTIDGENASLTYKEFELLQYLVLREGRTIERSELVDSLWQAGDDSAPGERTIDVHVRRLRSKLSRYEDIVRTVRGVGYRFDRHADVVIRYGTGAPSPDRF